MHKMDSGDSSVLGLTQMHLTHEKQKLLVLYVAIIVLILLLLLLTVAIICQCFFYKKER